MQQRKAPTSRLIALAAAAVLLMSGCGDDDDGFGFGSSTTGGTTAPETGLRKEIRTMKPQVRVGGAGGTRTHDQGIMSPLL